MFGKFAVYTKLPNILLIKAKRRFFCLFHEDESSVLLSYVPIVLKDILWFFCRSRKTNQLQSFYQNANFNEQDNEYYHYFRKRKMIWFVIVYIF